MAEQEQYIRAMKNVSDQMTGLTTTMGAQSVARIIKPFEGDVKEFKGWIKSIEKYVILTNLDVNQSKLIAYQSSKGPVSDFLKRHLDQNAGHTWAQVKAELTSRFAEVTDHQYALSLLRKVRQKRDESIQVYAERLLALAEDAFDDVDAANEQLIGFFIDGLQHDYMKMKIMRANPDTLQAAINVANTEQNLRRRFELRSGHPILPQSSSTEVEPMEIGHARPKCYKCHKVGHKIKDCRYKQGQINFVNDQNKPRSRQAITCWNCSQKGHYANECKVKQNARNGGRQQKHSAAGISEN